MTVYTGGPDMSTEDRHPPQLGTTTSAQASDEVEVADNSHQGPVPNSRNLLRKVGGGIARVLTAIWTVVKDSPAALITIGSLWLFAIVPSLRPWQPPEEQGVTISNVRIAERRLTHPETREEVTVVFFNAEVIGYDRKEIQVATLWMDALTGERADDTPDLVRYKSLSNFTRTDRSVVWLNVPYPALRDESLGCLFIRVLLFNIVEPQDTVTQPPVSEPTPEPRIIGLSQQDFLAYGDSAPFAPFDDGSCSGLEFGTPAVP
jgi:hypothetical protein